MGYANIKILYQILLPILILYSCANSAESQSGKLANEKRILDSLFGNNRYDARIRPAGNLTNEDGPVAVTVNMFLRQIESIDDVRRSFRFQLTFRQQWTDQRLRFDSQGGKIRYINLNEAITIWKPDTFFTNELQASMHNVMAPNSLLRITPLGEVLYSVRVTLTTSCPMNFAKYPHDRQKCRITLASYGHTTDDIVYVWKNDTPLQVTKNLGIIEYSFDNYETGYCTSRTNTGEYSCILADLTFDRLVGPHLKNAYLPCVMLVIITWLSFWMSTSNANAQHNGTMLIARAALILTALAILTVHCISLSMAPLMTSYNRSIDIWTGSCLTFVLAAIVEFVFVCRAELCGSNSNNRDAPGNANQQQSFLEDGANDSKTAKSSKRWRRYISSGNGKCNQLDAISRIAFPLAFVLFTFLYILCCT